MARKKKLGGKIYAISLAVYTLALIIVAIYGLSIVWDYAEEYEKSRPNNTMDEYVENLSKNLWDDSIADTIAAMPHEMQSDSECADIVKEMLSAGISYSRMPGGSDDAMSISYSLLCGDSVFGQVTLMEDESKKEEVKFDMLPWTVYKEEFDFTGLYSSVQVTVPATFSVELNGHELDEEYIVEEGIKYDVLDNYYDDYPNLPTKVTYKYDNVIGTLEPVIYDEDGNEFVIDPEKDDSQFISYCDETELSHFNEFAETFCDRYFNYISGIYDPSYGYQRLLPYMKLGSDLDERMKQAMDGLSWAHTSSVRIDYVTLNSAIDISDGFYILDVSAGTTTLHPGQGEVVATQNMRLIVTDSGNDIRAVMMELY